VAHRCKGMCLCSIHACMFAITLRMNVHVSVGASAAKLLRGGGPSLQRPVFVFNSCMRVCHNRVNVSMHFSLHQLCRGNKTRNTVLECLRTCHSLRESTSATHALTYTNKHTHTHTSLADTNQKHSAYCPCDPIMSSSPLFLVLGLVNPLFQNYLSHSCLGLARTIHL